MRAEQDGHNNFSLKKIWTENFKMVHKNGSKFLETTKKLDINNKKITEKTLQKLLKSKSHKSRR